MLQSYCAGVALPVTLTWVNFCEELKMCRWFIFKMENAIFYFNLHLLTLKK